VITAIVTACFQTAYPNGPYPTFVGEPGNGNNGKWIGNTTENQFMYAEQLRLSNPPENDYTWRIVLAFSAVPAAATMYFRLHMAETPRFTLHVLKNAAAMTNDMSHMLEGEEEAFDQVSSKETEEVTEESVPFSTFVRRYGVHLAGAALSWFFLDVGFYSQSLFQKDVFLQVGFIPPANRMNALTESMVTAKAQALIALGSTIPGYWVTVFTVDILGRKNIQIGGFIAMTAFMAAMSGAYTHLLNPNTPRGEGLSPNQPMMRNGWIAMYAFTFFFANWGPNSTTFIVPAELFPTQWKATGHGFCAAVGKAGAIIGSFGFLFAAQPHQQETTWSFPCDTNTDFYFDPVTGEKLGCKIKNTCPIGLAVTSTDVPGLCDFCNPKLLTGCAPFGVGVQGALGILAAINFLGLLTSFMIPETMGKTLEELSGVEPLIKVGPEKDLDMVGLPAETYA
jgi:MFS transporter, PHS family, inorganic phosphate transporter